MPAKFGKNASHLPALGATSNIERKLLLLKLPHALLPADAEDKVILNVYVRGIAVLVPTSPVNETEGIVGGHCGVNFIALEEAEAPIEADSRSAVAVAIDKKEGAIFFFNFTLLECQIAYDAGGCQK